ncbi:MAG TPA: response regulator [Nocardioidaceae bacterium]|nr:response regulator [Nocardioidaceae bacterium]
MAGMVEGPEQVRVSSDPASMHQAKILLVDDRPDNLLALSAILSSLGHGMVRAHSGEEALKSMLSDEFALVILDVQMPGMDGYATATHIKRRERTRGVPIIFLTASYADPQDAFRGYAAGAVDYITKPFDPWVLRAKVSVFVDLYLKNRQLREQAALLRTLLGGVAGPMASQQLLNELSARLASVEEQASTLSEQTDPARADTLDGALEELNGRVARLRLALDVLRPE